jgi:hypothetical protein
MSHPSPTIISHYHFPSSSVRSSSKIPVVKDHYAGNALFILQPYLQRAESPGGEFSTHEAIQKHKQTNPQNTQAF